MGFVARDSRVCPEARRTSRMVITLMYAISRDAMMTMSRSRGSPARVCSLTGLPSMMICSGRIATVMDPAVVPTLPLMEVKRSRSLVLSGNPIESRKKIRSRYTTFTSGVVSRTDMTLFFLFRLNLMGFTL